MRSEPNKKTDLQIAHIGSGRSGRSDPNSNRVPTASYGTGAGPQRCPLGCSKAIGVNTQVLGVCLFKNQRQLVDHNFRTRAASLVAEAMLGYWFGAGKMNLINGMPHGPLLQAVIWGAMVEA